MTHTFDAAKAESSAQRMLDALNAGALCLMPGLGEQLVRGISLFDVGCGRGRAVFEELLLSAIEDRGLQADFIAKLRDRLVLQQMPP